MEREGERRRGREIERGIGSKVKEGRNHFAVIGHLFLLTVDCGNKEKEKDLVQLFADKNFSLRVQSRAARWFSFNPKIPIWVKSWRPLDRKMLSYFMTLWNILRPFGITYWYCLWSFGTFFPVLVCLDQEKSGNPGPEREREREN
jgi:hypothetical protein